MLMATEQAPVQITAPPTLRVDQLHLFLGAAHILQGIDLELADDHLVLVGRNGMGKSMLCASIMRMQKATGSVTLCGQQLLGQAPHVACRGGIGYVPQGRRMWPSLSVDETLTLAGRGARRWRKDMVYTLFPRLTERRRNGATQLSGGEQQMLAIGRALLMDPKLLLLDEPSEGLAPVIVDQLTELLRELPRSHGVKVFLIEQNLRMAASVGERLHVMVNGRIDSVVSSAALMGSADLRRSLLGVASA